MFKTKKIFILDELSVHIMREETRNLSGNICYPVKGRFSEYSDGTRQLCTFKVGNTKERHWIPLTMLHPTDKMKAIESIIALAAGGKKSNESAIRDISIIVSQ